MRTSELLMPGKHNQANALAALALGDVMRLPMDAMLSVLRRFPGLAHRTQWVAEIDGVNWYNDSKGTNVGATVAAIAGMPGRKVLIAGGDGKGADFTPLKNAIDQGDVTTVVLFGRDAELIHRAVACSAPVQFAGSLQEAVQKAKALAAPGDNVLFSPACASFDMFANFVQRGEAFIAAVKGLA
jgi:UDP-N-acetylmuramoylalanine--D-glutamate ligase